MPSETIRMDRKYEWLLIVAVALVIRIAYCACIHQSSHHREYVIAAARLLEHKTLLSPLMSDAKTAEVSGLMPPMYTVWVAAIYSILGVETRAATVILELTNAIAISLSCGLVFSIAGSFAGRRAAWIAGAIAALNPVLIGYTNYIWDTSIFALAVTTSVWMSLRLRNRPTGIFPFFCFGIWLGVVALLNPALTPAYPFLVLFPLWRRNALSRRQVLGGIMVSVLGWMIAIGPWIVRNYVQLGTPQYVRSGFMLEVWLGATPEAELAGGDVYRKHFPLLNQEVARHVSEVGERKYLQECGELARRAISENPMRFAKLCLMRIVDFWFGTTLTHAGPQQGIIPATNQRKLIMLVLTFEVLLLIVMPLTGRLTRPETWWLLSVVVVFSLIYSITHVQVRFRVPIEPLIAVLVGMSFAARKIRSGQAAT